MINPASRYVLFILLNAAMVVQVYPLPQSNKPHMLRQIRTDGQNKTAVFIFIPLLTAVTERVWTVGGVCVCGDWQCGVHFPAVTWALAAQARCARASVTECQGRPSACHSQTALGHRIFEAK